MLRLVLLVLYLIASSSASLHTKQGVALVASGSASTRRPRPPTTERATTRTDRSSPSP